MKTRTIISFLVMVAGVLGLGFFAPWWAGPIWIIVVTGISKLKLKQNILMGGLAISVVWATMAVYMNSLDKTDLISKTGALLGGLSFQLMLIITIVVAFITGILSGWLGGALGSLVLNKANHQNPE